MNHAMTNTELGWLLLGAIVTCGIWALTLRMWLATILAVVVGVVVYGALIA